MEENKKPKRDIILDAAFKLFVENGYANTKIIDIAEEANIGKGTVYEYFKSKDTLFCEIFKKKVVTNYSKVSKLIDNDKTSKENLKTAIQFELDSANSFGNIKNMFPYICSPENNDHNKEVFSAMHELMELNFQVIYKIISRGIASGEFKDIDPLMSTISLIGAINFFIAFSCNVIPMHSFDKIKEHHWDTEEFFNMIFNGIVANS